MASVSKEEIKEEIYKILKGADLKVLSAKTVRLQLEEKFDCDLLDRKKEIVDIVTDYVNEQEDDEAEESEDDKPITPKATAKRGKAAKKTAAESDDGSDEPPAKTKRGKRKAGSDNDSDGSYKKPRAAKKAAKKEKGTKPKGTGKATGFTRAYQLSPKLAAFMGAESLPRHEVVKKMWAIIKERNLYDPKNKQYAICDSELHEIMGVKRFRTFGMLKYLKNHFID